MDDCEKIQPQVVLGNYFCRQMILKLATQQIFPKKLADIGHRETNQRYEIKTSFFFHVLVHVYSI